MDKNIKGKQNSKVQTSKGSGNQSKQSFEEIVEEEFKEGVYDENADVKQIEANFKIVSGQAMHNEYDFAYIEEFKEESVSGDSDILDDDENNSGDQNDTDQCQHSTEQDLSDSCEPDEEYE